ncbi:MAG: glutathione synthetase, partial [Pseudomonadota bacterium]
MGLNVACQMDPIDRIDIRGDSTFALLLEAQRRGHGLFYYTPKDLALRGTKLEARGHVLKVLDQVGSHYQLTDAEVVDLASQDVVLLRQDPPFDMAYITTTHLLERLAPGTLVVNDPASVRNAPEKVFVLDFQDLMPPTMVTRSLDDVRAFRREYKDIIIKPLYGNGGASVFKLGPEDTNLNSLVELFQTVFREPFMVQQYVPDVRKGDKRIILVDGAFAGAINRVPAADETRSNMHVGGKATATELT